MHTRPHSHARTPLSPHSTHFRPMAPLGPSPIPFVDSHGGTVRHTTTATKIASVLCPHARPSLPPIVSHSNLPHPHARSFPRVLFLPWLCARRRGALFLCIRRRLPGRVCGALRVPSARSLRNSSVLVSARQCMAAVLRFVVPRRGRVGSAPSTAAPNRCLVVGCAN